MNKELREDLTKFSKKQLVEIIVMCHKANKYYLTKEIEAIEEIEEILEIAKDYEDVNLVDRLEIILKTLRGEDNE